MTRNQLVIWAVVLQACGAGLLPDQAVTHNGEGVGHLAAGRLDDAEASFWLALEYHPQFSEPRANLALVALERGRLGLAERHARSAIELNEDFAIAWANLGVVLERKGADPDAQHAYEHALAIDPGLVAPRRNLAFLHARRAELQPARAQLMRLIQLQPHDHEAAGLLAWCELRLGHAQAALRRAEAVLERAPTAPTASVVRGILRARANDLDGALEDLKRAATDPVLGRHARLRLTAVRLFRGEYESAYRMARALVDERPHSAAARLVMARASLQTGRHDEAIVHATAALRLKPALSAARDIVTHVCANVSCAP